ncbi:uncharacterized protein LAESUDRAFT_562459 [Laetiporus sulphureus 93-53]|uniref:Uncharacterized protein n=1 Tax=Laetiporus sulphureus 93-53 TaxID=1314785 RepID=A0A165B4P5_9APHY|nr:uncharacterized protein LAESUDRAFT_562459 [Laetiporus sulphureus 93-53]KZT00229.1 hypothetical protein LAESUDRAFT_562459 [Laetiporus sulphureus 93-53]
MTSIEDPPTRSMPLFTRPPNAHVSQDQSKYPTANLRTGPWTQRHPSLLQCATSGYPGRLAPRTREQQAPRRLAPRTREQQAPRRLAPRTREQQAHADPDPRTLRHPPLLQRVHRLASRLPGLIKTAGMGLKGVLGRWTDVIA